MHARARPIYIMVVCKISAKMPERADAHQQLYIQIAAFDQGAGMRRSNSSTMEVISSRRGQIEWLEGRKFQTKQGHW